MIWECIGRCYPEQYDIYRSKGPAIAYFRIHHGNLSVHPYKHGRIDWDTVIYEKHYNDERGGFEKSFPEEKEEFNRVFRIINFKIYCYLFKQWFKNLWK